MDFSHGTQVHSTRCDTSHFKKIYKSTKLMFYRCFEDKNIEIYFFACFLLFEYFKYYEKKIQGEP